ncbi:MAG TPA: hypothetical protein V6C72_04495 [Chroococcales cyanobacterium]
MSSYQHNALEDHDLPSQSHKDALDVEGLDHIFRWASDVVADGEDARVRIAREKRVRRHVLEIVQKAQEQKAMAKVYDELNYLHRLVIALLQKLQDVTEENATLRQISVSQFYALERVPFLEAEVKHLKGFEEEREAAVLERRYLMDALAKIKRDRDYLDELLHANEAENVRAARLIAEAKDELARLKSRKWWHFFVPTK